MEFIGYVCALFMAGLTFLFWRKTSVLSSRVEEGDVKKSKLHQKLATRDNEISSLRLERGNLSKKEHKHEKQLKTAEQKRRALEALIKQQADRGDNLQSLENELDHYKGQCQALTSQLREVDAERGVLKTNMDTELKELNEKLRPLKSENKDQSKKINELANRLKNKDQDILKLKETAKSQDKTLEVKKLNKKLSQYLHFYKTLKSQKELLEEQNSNWETAVKYLAHWTVEQKTGTPPDSSQKLGEIVGEALGLIKKDLMTDEFSFPPPPGQNHERIDSAPAK